LVPEQAQAQPGDGERSMISTWWLMVAFVVGIYAGISLMALLYFSQRNEDDVGELPDVMHPS
jgi:uncharacterized protein involved in exopolysaccharide biosynthesis